MGILGKRGLREVDDYDIDYLKVLGAFNQPLDFDSIMLERGVPLYYEETEEEKAKRRRFNQGLNYFELVELGMIDIDDLIDCFE